MSAPDLVAEARAAAPPKAETLGRIADLLARNGIDVDDIGRVQKVNLWHGFMKDADGAGGVGGAGGASKSTRIGTTCSAWSRTVGICSSAHSATPCSTAMIMTTARRCIGARPARP